MQILYIIADGKLHGRLLSNEHGFYHIRMTLPLLFPTVSDEPLAQDLLDDEEEVEVQYLGKLYNAFYIQMEACCTVSQNISFNRT